MSKGWISIHRELQNHWLWNEKRVFSKLEAWIDILLTVNHKEKKITIKNTLFIVKRGESINSLDTWAKRWNWNKSKVRRFLNMLKSDSMIELKSESKTTRLTVCKYDSYQDIRNDNETIMKHKRNDNETIMTPNNNVNNINKENNNINMSGNEFPDPMQTDLLKSIEEVEKENKTIDFKKLLNFINEQTKRTGKEKFRVINKSVKAKYKARLKDGYTNEDIANSIKNAVKDNYHIENNFKYLTPEFFSRADKIDKHGFKNVSNNSKKINKENFISNPYKNE